uniref:Uncharacterized protein n=1 Tax=Panagrolaimus superbus TaxID=310955 RepID=A0A914Y2H6_9BILA
MTNPAICTGVEATTTMSTSIITQSTTFDPTNTCSILDNGNEEERVSSSSDTEGKNLQIVEEMEVDSTSNAEISSVDEIQDENHISNNKIADDIPEKEEVPMEIDVESAKEEVKQDSEVNGIENELSPITETISVPVEDFSSIQKPEKLPFESYKIPSSNFDYKRYMNLTSSDAAEHPILYSCHNAAIMKVFNAVFVPDMSIKIVNGEHKDTFGVIKSICYPTLTVETKELQTIHVNFADTRLIFDGYDIHFWTRYVTEEIANKIVSKLSEDKKYEEPLHSFIKESHYLEIINDDNPEFVDTVKVVENRCGLLKVEYVNGKEEFIHMASPRLKPLGWVHFVVDDFTKGRYYIENDDLIGVPPFCFDVLAFDVNNSNAMSQWMPFSPHRIDASFFNTNTLFNM